ncbi:exported hypothetical protein [Actinacidiphila cocklensis]|uniref:Uncharacterized protein n=1 Tax=Actinacidiphila cocklensis TaxID=887465 RepID=A0A9W4DUW1_9ACTN|nr:exported hypothetical protein [Actinacidiphila cocklensis]
MTRPARHRSLARGRARASRGPAGRAATASQPSMMSASAFTSLPFRPSHGPAPPARPIRRRGTPEGAGRSRAGGRTGGVSRPRRRSGPSPGRPRAGVSSPACRLWSAGRRTRGRPGPADQVSPPAAAGRGSRAPPGTRSPSHPAPSVVTVRGVRRTAEQPCQGSEGQRDNGRHGPADRFENVRNGSQHVGSLVPEKVFGRSVLGRPPTPFAYPACAGPWVLLPSTGEAPGLFHELCAGHPQWRPPESGDGPSGREGRHRHVRRKVQVCAPPYGTASGTSGWSTSPIHASRRTPTPSSASRRPGCAAPTCTCTRY